MHTPLRSIIVREYGEPVAASSEEVAKSSALDCTTVMTAVLRYGPGILGLINKYGSSILDDLKALNR